MSINISLRHTQQLRHPRAWHRQLSGMSACSCTMKRTNNPSPLIGYYQKSTSFSTARIAFSWKHTLSLRTYSSLQQPMVAMAPRRVSSLSNHRGSGNVRAFSKITSKSKPPPTAEEPPSFFQSLYDETHLLLQSLHQLIFSDLPILIPRIIAFAGTLQLSSEYGFNTVNCEGPSMEPTIIDGSYTCVLIERWSHRLFGLEKDDDHVGESKRMDVTTEEEQSQSNHNGERNYYINSWYALLCGIWEQHFASGLQRGDVIILHHPSKEATICKRIIGMPGDTIVRTDGGGRESSHCMVPPGHVWIEGDNTLNSLDSRSYGTVPASLVIGKVVCRLWPLREYSSLGTDGNGIEHWNRVSARIGRCERPLTGNKKETFNGSYLLANESGETDDRK
ncbi:hypothetical protein ACHAXR_006847 [Thalassiosira sp. AJA248-18]